jgi:ATPase subunit of ABC transporter with duplicated ATPase domains
MKLISAQVTNFRSVEDSESFDMGQVLCLVGKNEAGKTAVVQAIAGLNPHPATPISFDKERDYPRRFFTEYASRHGGEEAVVVKTKWEIDDEEKRAIIALLGPESLSDATVSVSRRYGSEAPEWELPINYAKAVEHLIEDERLSTEERTPLSNANNTQTLREALTKIPAPTEKQTQLLNRINAYPGQNISGSVRAVLSKNFPSFMYFSHYWGFRCS